MARHRAHSIEFKRHIAQEYIAGKTLHALAKRHDLSRNLIRIWVTKLEASAVDEDGPAGDLFPAFFKGLGGGRVCNLPINRQASFSSDASSAAVKNHARALAVSKYVKT